jgi:8-oxo-dGTP pyrophosphatase MutT (NUDIX family)
MKNLLSYKMFEFKNEAPLETVVGLLIRSRQTGRFFLIHRNDKNKYWSLLSGGQDADDLDDMATLKREMAEELMIKGISIDIFQGGEELLKSGQRIFRWYMGYCDVEFAPILDEENLSWGWFDPTGTSKINGDQHFQGLPNHLYPGLLEKILDMKQKDIK